MKTAAERSIEVLTWAAVAIWLGFALVADILEYVWIVVMVLGIILLSSAIYQRSRGWHTSISLWVFGIWMAVFSVVETVGTLLAAVSGNDSLKIDLKVYLGIALVSMGVAFVFRTIQGPQMAPDQYGSSRRQGDTGYSSRDRRSYTPRRVEENTSSGWIPSPQDRAAYDAQDDYGRSRSSSSRRGRQQADDYEYDQPPRNDDQYAPRSRSRGSAPSRADEPSTRRGRQQADDYDQPPRNDAQYTPRSRAPRYEDQPHDDDQYTQPSVRSSRRQDYYRTQQAPTPPPTQERQRSSGTVRPQRRSRRVESGPSDLESRVDDIIRRSRERRGGGESAPPHSPDDLPY